MHWSFQRKLAAVICLITLGICLALYLSVRTSFTEGFYAYLTESRQQDADKLVSAIEEQCQTTEQWQQFTQSPRHFHDLVRTTLLIDPAVDRPPIRDTNIRNHPELRPGMHPETRRGAERRPPRNRPPGKDRFARPPANIPFTLLDDNKNIWFYRDNYQANWSTLPIHVDQQVVGFLAITPIKQNTSVADKLFIDTQNQWFLIIAMGSALLFAILAWPISIILISPLRRLSNVVDQLSNRNYAVRANINSRDDFGKLAREFNAMAEKLGEYDQRQRNWIADISHELRTPLAIMQAEIEAIQDGVRPASSVFINSLQSETLHLRQLVDDLHAIVLSDSKQMTLHKEPVDIRQLIQEQQLIHANALNKKSLHFTLIDNTDHPENAAGDGPPAGHPAECWLDRNRMNQVLTNLLQNSIRYTDSDGRIECMLCNLDHQAIVEIIWRDTAPGVELPHLPHLFDRLYRVESSRNRATGGSGLGLAVCKAIVEQHGGKINAYQSSLGGLEIVIQLPKSHG